LLEDNRDAELTVLTLAGQAVEPADAMTVTDVSHLYHQDSQDYHRFLVQMCVITHIAVAMVLSVLDS
jgi:hypothetical protein